MSAMPPLTWHEANQRYLVAAVAVVRAALARHAARTQQAMAAMGDDTAEQALQEAAAAMPAPSALDMLVAAFGLSPFERDVVLLCAGLECDATIAPLCAAAQGDPQRPFPTFSLAVAALPDSHWSALTPAGPLRQWRLIELGPGPALIASPLRIDERILHFLAGAHYPPGRHRGPTAARRYPGAVATGDRRADQEALAALGARRPAAGRAALRRRERR